MATSAPLLLCVVFFFLFASPGLCWSNVLLSGSRLPTDQRLVYRDYDLIMQGDCNLVLYAKGRGAIWHTNTANSGKNCFLALQADAKLQLFGDRPAFSNPRLLWESGVSSVWGRHALVLNHDGSLRVYGPSNWSTAPPPAAPLVVESGVTAPAVVDSTLWSGDIAPIGVTIANGDYKLELPASCNLTLSNTKTGEILWYANIKDDIGIQDCYVNLGGNGELMIKYLGGAPLWTNGAGAADADYVLALMADGKMAVYGPPIWSNVKKIAIVTEERFVLNE